MTCPVNVSPSGGYPDGRTPGAGAKNLPSLRRSEVYPLVFPPVLLGPPQRALLTWLTAIACTW